MHPSIITSAILAFCGLAAAAGPVKGEGADRYDVCPPTYESVNGTCPHEGAQACEGPNNANTVSGLWNEYGIPRGSS